GRAERRRGHRRRAGHGRAVAVHQLRGVLARVQLPRDRGPAEPLPVCPLYRWQCRRRAVPPAGAPRRARAAMNVLLAGGGTGGHVYPALAVAEALHRRDPASRVLFVGSRGGMEASLVPAAGVPFVGLAVRAPRSRAPVRLAVSAASVVASLAQAVAVVARFAPDAMIATGGIAALPAVIAGAIQGTP